MRKAGSFHIESLGCAKNQVDSELMIASLEKAGWRFTPLAEEADVLIVNTCGFISDAKKESIETGLALRARFPGKKIYLVGCLTERYDEELSREMKEMDGFLGNRDPRRVVELVTGGEGGRSRGGQRRTRLLSPAGSAYLKIAEGCDNRCTYCAIPLIRGKLASLTRKGVLEEARALIKGGIRELVLVAQDLGSYGMDRGEAELPSVLEEISRLEGRFWVRLLYIHPDHFPRSIIPVMRDDPRLLPYFDIPFQHASPRILSAMGRVGDPEKNLALIKDIREALPGAVIRSTFLAGFPGEREDDFERLLDFQKRAALDWLGVFTYSAEEDTPAFRLAKRVPRRTAAARKRALEENQIPITAQALDRFLGKTLDVLIEEPVQGEELSIGRAYPHAPEVDGLVVVRGISAAGSVVRARVIRRNGIDLEGELVDG